MKKIIKIKQLFFEWVCLFKLLIIFYLESDQRPKTLSLQNFVSKSKVKYIILNFVTKTINKPFKSVYNI